MTVAPVTAVQVKAFPHARNGYEDEHVLRSGFDAVPGRAPDFRGRAPRELRCGMLRRALSRLMHRWDLFLLAAVLVLPSALLAAHVVGKWNIDEEEGEFQALLCTVGADAEGSSDDDAQTLSDAIGPAALALKDMPFSATSRTVLDEMVSGTRPPWEIDSETLSTILKRNTLLDPILTAAALQRRGRPLTTDELKGLADVGRQLAVTELSARSTGDDEDADAVCLGGFQLVTSLANNGGVAHDAAATRLYQPLHAVCAEQVGVDSRFARGMAIDSLRERKTDATSFEWLARRDLALYLLALHLRLIGPLPAATAAAIPKGWAVPTPTPPPEFLQQLLGRWAWTEFSLWARQEALPQVAAILPDVPARSPGNLLSADWTKDMQAAREARARRELDRRLMIGRLAMEMFHIDKARWPTDVAELVAHGPATAEELRNPVGGEAFTLIVHDPWASLMSTTGAGSIRATVPD